LTTNTSSTNLAFFYRDLTIRCHNNGCDFALAILQRFVAAYAAILTSIAMQTLDDNRSNPILKKFIYFGGFIYAISAFRAFNHAMGNNNIALEQQSQDTLSSRHNVSKVSDLLLGFSASLYCAYITSSAVKAKHPAVLSFVLILFTIAKTPVYTIKTSFKDAWYFMLARAVSSVSAAIIANGFVSTIITRNLDVIRVLILINITYVNYSYELKRVNDPKITHPLIAMQISSVAVIYGYIISHQIATALQDSSITPFNTTLGANTFCLSSVILLWHTFDSLFRYPRHQDDISIYRYLRDKISIITAKIGPDTTLPADTMLVTIR